MNGFGGSNPMGNTNVNFPLNQTSSVHNYTTLSFDSMNNSPATMAPNNVSSTKKAANDKAIALSAQEINEFLR